MRAFLCSEITHVPCGHILLLCTVLTRTQSTDGEPYVRQVCFTRFSCETLRNHCEILRNHREIGGEISAKPAKPPQNHPRSLRNPARNPLQGTWDLPLSRAPPM